MTDLLRDNFDNGLGACLQLLLTFGLMVWLVRHKMAVGYAILLGTVFLAVIRWMPPGEFFLSASASATNLKMWDLMAMIVLITFLGEVLGHVENLAKLVASILGLVRSRKVAMGALPAIIGLLPMPGGAMLSAPMVREVARGTNADPTRETLTNYWFRHIWEYVCPLYPGIVLISKLMDESVMVVIVYNLPLTIAAIIAGIFICFRGIDGKGEAPPRHRGILPILDAVWPVGFVILCTAVPMILEARGVELPRFLSRQSEIKWPLLGSISLVLIILHATHRIGAAKTWSMMKKSVTLEMAALVYGVILLQRLLEITQIADSVRQYLDWVGVPELLVVFIVPFAVAALTGMTVAFVGISFPLLASYLRLDDGSVHHIRVMFAFASGYMGIMLTPLHLCMVLTLDYFKGNRAKLYRSLFPLTIAVIAVAAGIAIVYEIVT